MFRCALNPQYFVAVMCLERIAQMLRMTPEELIIGFDPNKAQLIKQLDANDIKKLIVDCK